MCQVSAPHRSVKFLFADEGELCDCRAGMKDKCGAMMEDDRAKCLLEETTPTTSTTPKTPDYNDALSSLFEAFTALSKALANMFQ